MLIFPESSNKSLMNSKILREYSAEASVLKRLGKFVKPITVKPVWLDSPAPNWGVAGTIP